MRNLSVEVLISTCNDGFQSAVNVPLSPQGNVKYLIVHQVFGNFTEKNYESSLQQINQRQDVNVIHTRSQGLSISRNIALDNASGDIIIFTDDDVTLLPDFNSVICEAFCRQRDNSATTFKIKTPDGRPYKRYRSKAFVHNRISAIRVSSVEMAVRRRALEGVSIRFDERFGLGSRYPACEENIFIADLLNCGLKVGYEPQFIVEHAAESSGSSWSDVSSIEVRGALFRRVFGLGGAPLLLVFAFKQRRNFKKNHSFFKFLLHSFDAFFKIDRT